jgi:ABC-type nickel/cobalt efflux system permease component RcnA
MFGLDDWIAELGAGGLLVSLAVALLLGLRHATDPDHLTAVATLTLSEREPTRRSALLGLTWGLGHACTVLAFGLPVVLLGSHLPEPVQRTTELAVGLLIVALAVRLLVRWHRGLLHVHPHRHGDVVHAHPHVHERPTAELNPHVHEQPAPELDRHAFAHRHSHAEALGRTPLASFAIGLLHGAGGSAAVAILLVAAMPSRATAVAGLVLLAAGTAASMTLVTAAWGALMARGARHVETLAPTFGTLGVLFGAWYALGAFGAVPYVL